MHRPATQSITTAEQLLAAGDIGPCELVRGELIFMSPSGDKHSRVAAKIASRILVHVEAHGLGVVHGSEGGFYIERDPDTVRAPDAAFTCKARAAAAQPGFSDVVPDLVVEVVSPSDSASYVTDKAGQWLDAGVRLVWVIDPESRIVTVFRATGSNSLLRDTDALDGDDVLPGFRVSIAEILDV